MPATLISNIKQQSAHHTFQRGRGFDRSSAASRRPSPRVTRRLGTVGAVDVAAAPSRAVDTPRFPYKAQKQLQAHIKPNPPATKKNPAAGADVPEPARKSHPGRTQPLIPAQVRLTLLSNSLIPQIREILDFRARSADASLEHISSLISEDSVL